MRPIKHRFRSMEIGESYEVMNPPKWLRSAIYNYATNSGKHFSACKMIDGSLEIRRLSGPHTADDISRARSNGANIMLARRISKRQEAKARQGGGRPLLDQYRGAALPWVGRRGRYGLDDINDAAGKGVGVYLLWRGPRLIYIGYSQWLISRLANHRSTRKDSDRDPTAVTIILCETIEEARRKESELIYALEPSENIVDGVC